MVRFRDDLCVGRGDLSAAQWAMLEPLLPVGRKAGRPPLWAKRKLVDGIRWRLRRPTSRLRQDRLPRAPRRRVCDRPTQAQPRRGHAVRQAGRPL
ncbi:transposase [Nonomuraea bangladeshensis]|uniref:transposase n=1 Tax=Nonomuraea bangladeshensis TaxID=404385 RepID=UPI003C30BCB1